MQRSPRSAPARNAAPHPAVLDDLTGRQREVLAAIVERSESAGRPPTLRELAERMGVASTNAVRDHLAALAEKGYIHRDGHRARGIRLLRAEPPGRDGQPHAATLSAPAPDVVLVPVLGRVAAGQPVLADQNVEQHIAVDRGIIRDGDVFALRVQGDSMRDAGILDGDYVFVRQQTTAQPRDIVVALLGDETTVKRFVPSGSTIRLEPENPDFEPIVVKRGDPRLQILGKVSAVLRTIT